MRRLFFILAMAVWPLADFFSFLTLPESLLL